MTRLITAFLFVLLLKPAGSNSCSFITLTGSGISASQERITGSFSVIENNGPFRVLVQQGRQTALTITGETNILPEISTEVRNGRLYIGYRKQNLRATHQEVVISLVVPCLTALVQNGDGSIEGIGDWDRHDIRISNCGRGEINWSMTQAALFSMR
ncbi:GIN domain-containing protein [Flavihumibacter solisilvae]|uniref:Putative auto-transporter adhesin head GIN domain-containing protein n=1 Tax=Flavihumibacter solisilvae TaxID=1349421 RepID=A0A0C1KZ16_9BACT|nr:DUF2807 domain-containing protein [Flavihumibacter solisilvae]KIC92937.1 hypothetical protein OI18_19475 [Flavihumibacter solisilvae]